MEYQHNRLDYHGVTLDTYRTLDDRIWITVSHLANAVGVERQTVFNWLKRINYEGETLQVVQGCNNKKTTAYPLELTIVFLNYLVDKGIIKGRYYTAGDILDTLKAIKENSNHYKTPAKITSTRGHVYLICAEGTGRYKIGYTTTVENRMRNLQTSCPVQLSLVKSKRVSDAPSFEQVLHRHFKDKRTVGEWFTLSPDEVQDCINLMAQE